MPVETRYAAAMYSNEQPYGRGRRQPQPHYMQTENTLHSLQMQSGAKTITLAFQSNWRGHFIRIIVEENDWYNSIIVPLSVMGEFRQCVEAITKGGPDSKGMVESEGKTIFVRIENDGLLLGEKTGTRNSSVIISQAAIGDFKKMIDEMTDISPPGSSQQSNQQSKPRLDEKIFYSEKLSTGAKTIHLMLKENSLGRFARLVEGDGFRFTSIIIPAQQLEEFRRMLDEAISVSNQTP